MSEPQQIEPSEPQQIEQQELERHRAAKLEGHKAALERIKAAEMERYKAAELERNKAAKPVGNKAELVGNKVAKLVGNKARLQLIKAAMWVLLQENNTSFDCKNEIEWMIKQIEQIEAELQPIEIGIQRMVANRIPRSITMQRGTTKTGKELIIEMLGHLKTIMENKGKPIEEDAKSTLFDLVRSLTHIKDVTNVEAFADREEISDRLMKSLLARLRGLCYRALIRFEMSALYGKWRLDRKFRLYQECANAALAQYNVQNATDFVMDKSTRRQRIYLYHIQPFDIHLNFEATTDGSGERCTFFAEVTGEMDVTLCCKLDFVGGAGTEPHCSFCEREDGILHPKGVPLPSSSHWPLPDTF